jgi:hypothetical protein
MTTTATAGANVETLTATTICLVVSKGKFVIRRKASKEAITVEADKALLGLSKVILDSPEIQEINKLDAAMRQYVESRCLPSMFKGGIWLLPIGLVEEVSSYMNAYIEQREVLVGKACESYPVRCEETSKRLGVMSNMMDYPSVDRFRAKFHAEYRYVTFDTPRRLRAISPALFEAEREKAAQKLQVVADECRLAMREGLQQLVASMVEKLTPGEDGKKRRFHSSLIENFNDFLSTFELRNVTDDAELAAVVAQARAILGGVNAEDVRKNEAIRANLQAGFGQIAERLTPMVGVTRQIDFDDEE